MNRDHIIASIRKNLPEIKSQFGAESIALFGSYAREENSIKSDIDILVKMNSPDFYRFMALQRYFEKLLNNKVDLVRDGSHLSSRFFDIVGKDIIYV